MYLRHTTLRKDGKVHRYWRLVRSVRVGRKVIQQTVAHLGELDPEGRARAKALARAITGDREQSDLFEPGVAEEAIPVRLKRIRLERGRRFGDVWLGWTLWRALHLDEVLERLLPEGREAVPWSTMAAVLVLARLCEPSSELHIAEDWYRRTALEDLLALPAPLVNDDRLYRALDRLLPHKRALAESNPLAQRGYSRDHRPDCKQVCLALVVTRDGMPLGYEVFAGNRTDVTTVEEIVEAMEARYGVAERIWVMDRGMTSEDNLEWLRESGRRYLVGTPKTELRKWARQIADARDWHAVRDGIEAKQCVGPEGTETFVLVRSIERREKERAMHERFCRRIEAGLERLGQRVRRARRALDPRRLERQLGRLLERNQRAAGRYVIDFVPDPTVPAGVRLAWTARPEWDDWARWSEGCYVLRTNVADWTPEDPRRTSIQLTDAEAAVRIQKSELGLRPIWHQRADRVEAHILVCFLAYVLWKTLEQWQQRAGLGQSPRTVLDRKSTRLNSSHDQISYAVFCLKKKLPLRRHRAREGARLPHVVCWRAGLGDYYALRAGAASLGRAL